MNPVQISDALLTAAAALATDLALPVAMPGRNFEPTGTQYLEVTEFKNTTGNPTWGGEAVYMGILQIALHRPNDNEGSISPLTIATQIEAAFYKNRNIYGTGGCVRIYQHASVLTPIVETDKVVYPVSIPYLATKREGG